MAAGQYTFYVLPKNEVTSRFGYNYDYLDKGFLESHQGGASFPKVEIFAILDEYFENQRSLSYGPQMWGKDDSSSVKLIFDNEILVEVTIRLDLRCAIKAELASAINICHLLNGIMVNSDCLVIGESAESLINDIKRSKSFRFVTSPLAFLQEIEASNVIKKTEG